VNGDVPKLFPDFAIFYISTTSFISAKLQFLQNGEFDNFTRFRVLDFSLFQEN